MATKKPGASDGAPATNTPDGASNGAAPSLNPPVTAAISAPAGVTGCTVEGTSYEVDADGLVHVDPQHVVALLAHFGRA